VQTQAGHATQGLYDNLGFQFAAIRLKKSLLTHAAQIYNYGSVATRKSYRLQRLTSNRTLLSQQPSRGSQMHLRDRHTLLSKGTSKRAEISGFVGHG